MVFPKERMIVVVPADPNAVLACVDFGERCALIRKHAADTYGEEIDGAGWTLCEVKPYVSRLFIEKFTCRKRKFSRDLTWEAEFGRAEDVEFLDGLARTHGLLTITGYYQAVQKARAEVDAQANEAHEMVSSWTHDLTSADLLKRLEFDQQNRGHLIDHYTHGWYYVVISDSGSEYFKARDTRALLSSLIVQTKEAIARGVEVRFGYCLREYTEGKEWRMAPCGWTE